MINKTFIMFSRTIRVLAMIFAVLTVCSKKAFKEGNSLERYSDIITVGDIGAVSKHNWKLRKKVKKDQSSGGIYLNFFIEYVDKFILYFEIEKFKESLENIIPQIRGGFDEVQNVTGTEGLGFTTR